MLRRFKGVFVKWINNCYPNYATKAIHLASWPNTPRTVQNQTTTTQQSWTIVLYTHVLCDDLVLFRLRSKEFSPVCTGTAFLFVDCHRSENQFQENINTSNRRKNAKTWTERKTSKHDLASFSAQATPKGGPKPLQKLRGAANLQSEKSRFLASKQN